MQDFTVAVAFLNKEIFYWEPLLVKINYGATALSFKCTRYTKSHDRLYKLMICGTITVSADKTCYFWSSFERLDLELVNCESNLGVCIKSKKVPRITAFEIDAQQHTKNWHPVKKCKLTYLFIILYKQINIFWHILTSFVENRCSKIELLQKQ